MTKILENVNFPGEKSLYNDEPELIFEHARNAVLGWVKKYDTEPLLVGWRDVKDNKVSPSEICKDEESEPGWVRYAKAHGGNLTVNVNDGEYIFIYRSAPQFEETPG